MSLNFKNLKGDFWGGLTAGIVTLPLALAFGLQSGLGAVSGLYCAIILGLIAVVFGGTPALISTPTGPMTVVATLVISQVIASTGSLESGMGTIVGIFLLAGTFQIIFGVIRIGGYVKYIPYPVLSGFMTGIGVILISLEIYPLVGLASPKDIIKVFLHLPQALSQLNFQALALGGMTLLIIFSLPKLTTAIPASLAALIVGTSVSVFFGLSVPMIGDIPQGVPSLQLSHLPTFDIHKIPFVLSAALTLGALGCIDTLLTSVVADQITKTRHKSNRELIGQGLGNFTSALFGGLPGRVVNSGNAEWIIDVLKDRNFPRARQAIEIGVHAGFAFPVLIGTRVVGVMEFFSEETLEPDPKLLEVMEGIGYLLGRIFERYQANIQKEEYDEHLRSLYNRLESARQSEDKRIAGGLQDELK